MPDDLAFTLVQWHDFFLAAAGAGAVLLGLVFIGLIIHFGRQQEPPALASLAMRNASTLFYPVIVSLLMLMPPAQPWLPSLALFVIALVAVLTATAPITEPNLRALWVARHRAAGWIRYVVPAISGLVLIGDAGWLLVDPTSAIYVAAVAILLYFMAGTQNVWDLLLGGRFDMGAPTDPGHDQTGDGEL